MVRQDVDYGPESRDPQSERIECLSMRRWRSGSFTDLRYDSTAATLNLGSGYISFNAPLSRWFFNEHL